MLQVSNLSKAFGAELVLSNISFTLSPGARAGLVGANGSGKSTLLRIIAGELVPDAGSARVIPTGTVAYLPQYPVDELHLTIRAALLRGAGRLGALSERIDKLEAAMPAAGEHLEPLLLEYAEVREEFERLGGYELEARMESVVQGLGLNELDLGAPVHTLSGGNKTKLSLARLLLSGARLLLLDEPTNYLDLPALLWLERFVREGNRTYLMVSHDRRFLDRTVDTILELDPVEHTLRQFPGSYSAYAETRLREEQKQLEAYRDQQAEIARIEEDIRRTKEQARGVEARTKSGLGADHARRIAKKVAAKAKARERKLERQLDDHRVEKPRQSWRLHLADLGRDPIQDERTVLETEELHARYDGREVLRGVNLLVRGRDRIGLLGENGSGKTTLLRCVAGGMPFDGTVRLGPSIRAGLLSQESDELPLDRTVLEVFRARTEMYEADARTYLHKFLFTGQEVFKPIRALSYGQRSKLALAILILSGANFLILDEPTSHMDMPALEAIERSLEEYEGPSLVVTHDRYFLERIGVTRIEVMDQGVLRPAESVERYEQEIMSERDVKTRLATDAGVI